MLPACCVRHLAEQIDETRRRYVKSKDALQSTLEACAPKMPRNCHPNRVDGEGSQNRLGANANSQVRLSKD
jgi:hypothetical protein